MKNLLFGLVLAVIMIAGLALVIVQATAPTAQAYVEPHEYTLGNDCGSWGQIKICMSGGCIQECCPENCKNGSE